MGLIDSTQNIDKEMKVIANLSKEKETTKEVNARVERKLEVEFNELFSKKGSLSIYDFYNVERRQKIIQKLGENDYEYVRLNKLYDKVLKQIFKIYKQHEKYVDWYCNGLEKKK